MAEDQNDSRSRDRRRVAPRVHRVASGALASLLLTVASARALAALRVDNTYELWIATPSGCPVQLLDGTLAQKPTGSPDAPSADPKTRNIVYKAVYRNASTMPIRAVTLQWTASGASGEVIHTQVTLLRGDRPLQPGRTATRTLLGGPPESEIDRYVVGISAVEFIDGSRWPRGTSPEPHGAAEPTSPPTAGADGASSEPPVPSTALSTEGAAVPSQERDSTVPPGTSEQVLSTEAPAEIRGQAAKGDPESQYRIGLKYEAGEGVLQDYVEAYMWLNLAAAQGHAEAKTQRDSLAALMTPQQIAEAQRRARKWKPRK